MWGVPRVSADHLTARREQILAAARACFLRNGLHTTSMQDLIREAGLSVGAVYRYFKSKNEIINAIAETVAEMRDKPGQFGFVGANGGTMSKYSVGIYSTLPVDWRTDRSAALNAEVAALPKVSVTEAVDGPATVETYSVRYDWPHYYVRLGFDPRTAEGAVDRLRFSAGVRF